jgi:hypothetical protein
LKKNPFSAISFFLQKQTKHKGVQNGYCKNQVYRALEQKLEGGKDLSRIDPKTTRL